jgi:hypothetical protein
MEKSPKPNEGNEQEYHPLADEEVQKERKKIAELLEARIAKMRNDKDKTYSEHNALRTMIKTTDQEVIRVVANKEFSIGSLSVTDKKTKDTIAKITLNPEISVTGAAKNNTQEAVDTAFNLINQYFPLNPISPTSAPMEGQRRVGERKLIGKNERPRIPRKH